MTPEDGALVRRTLGGDKESYALLYDRYARLVRAICHSTTKHLPDAEDLAQEVFLRAYGKLDTLKDPDLFSSWLIGIARRTCMEWGRATRKKMSQLSNDPPTPNSPPSRDEEMERLIVALSRLPEKERLAVQAFYLLEQSADDAGSAMQLSRSGFYRVLDRARRRLGEMLGADKEATS